MTTHAPFGRDARRMKAPVLVIGDVHNCANTLDALLREVGGSLTRVPKEHVVVSVGDLHNKGTGLGPGGEPGSVEVTRWALMMQKAGKLILADSNHGYAVARAIERRRQGIGARRPSDHVVEDLLRQHDGEELVASLEQLLLQAPSFVRLPHRSHPETLVAHAGVSERMLAVHRPRDSERAFHRNAEEFRWQGQAAVVVGHVTVPDVTTTREYRDGEACGPVHRIDTGVEAGNKLSAYLVNDDTFLQVPTVAEDIAVLAHTQ